MSLTESLPKRVKVAGAIYKIEALAQGAGDDKSLYGRAIHESRVIQIAPDLTSSREAETLLHELLHCIECQWDLAKDAAPEHRVEVYERGLHAVIVDNPKLFDWIVRELRRPHRGD